MTFDEAENSPEKKPTPVSDTKDIKPCNAVEKQELRTMIQDIVQARLALGAKEEQIEDLKAEKQATLELLSQKKQAYKSRVVNIGKSYGVDMAVRDGVVWGFDESDLSFKSQTVPMPG